MENQEMTQEQQAFLYLIQTLDKATKVGAYTREEVLSYNNALNILDKFFSPKEVSNEEVQNMELKNHFVLEYLEDQAIPIAYVLGSGNKKVFITTKTFLFTLSNGKVFIIPKGFRFDGSSIPRIFWWFAPRLDDRILGSLIHDMMYYDDYKREQLGDKAAKELADKEMLYWWDAQLPNRKRINRLMYFFRKAFGMENF